MTKTTLLFFATAPCEIIGRFLPWLWLKRNASIWLLLLAGILLTLFVQSLALHPAASGCVHVAYGGVYVYTALIWLRAVDGMKLTLYDWTGALIALCGMLIIVAGWRYTWEHKSVLSIRYEEVSANKRYPVSPFANHLRHKYTPSSVITPALSDLHTCMVVARLHRFHASRQVI